MKHNAMIRIVLWSLLALVLLGILITSLFGYVGRNRFRISTEATVVQVDLGQAAAGNATQEAIPETVPATIPQTTPAAAPSSPAAGIAIDPSQVRNLEIDWAAGSVTIAPSNVGRITISETPVDKPEEALAYTLHGDTLRIRYYEKKTNPSFNHRHSKDLTILVPQDFVLNALSVDTASADLSVTDMSIGEADVDGASGRCRFENCQLGSLSVDTVSGDVFVSGTATELDLDCVSSSIQAQLTNVPNEISSDTTSGSLELTLPKDAGFTLELETISGNFRSDFDTTKNGSIYRCGDGRCEIEVDSVSGGVTIRKGA